MKPILPVMDYVFNYEYIVKELCENKAKPEMQCNGKCYLMKEMAKTSENDNPVSSDKKASHHEFEVLYLTAIGNYDIVGLQEPISSEVNADYSNLYFLEKTVSFFHPPSSIA